MKELIQKVDNLDSRVGKLEALEDGGSGVSLQATYPGTADTGNINVSGNINAGTGLYIGGVQVLASGLWANRPGSPVDGQKYTATDRGDQGIEFQWKASISKWLTTQKYLLQPSFDPGLTLPITVNSTLARGDNPEQTLDIYLLTLTMSSSIAATYNSTNFWTYQLFSITSGGVATGMGTQSTWVIGRAAGSRYPNVYTINTQFTAANFAAYRLDLATSGAPGGITPNPPILIARYVGT